MHLFELRTAPASREIFTIECWVRFASLDTEGTSPIGHQLLIFKQNSRSNEISGFELSKTRPAEQDLFTFVVTSATGQSATLTSTSSISINTWYHLAAIGGANFSQLFVNGQLEAQTNVDFPQDYGNQPLYFGTSGQDFWDHRFHGDLDEISFYNRPLAEGEIAAIYAAGSAGKCVAASISAQPQSLSVTVGATADFSVTASGSENLGYAWRFDGSTLPGATSSTLSITNVQLLNSGNYQVVVTNEFSSITSSLATLTVTSTNQVRADALILVNSASARYLDYKHYIEPYLENFGVPYCVKDIATNNSPTDLATFALIIVGHSQFDTNHTYLTTNLESAISLAISNGSGLVNFDSDLSVTSGVPRYQFVQDVFGFGYNARSTAQSVAFPTTEPQIGMHYITSLHATNETLYLSNSMSLAGLVLGTNSTAIATAGGRPFVSTTHYGKGRAVQWSSYDWVSATVMGPVNGLDDLLWRGLVWAASKPFVMRGLPNFVAMRVDDVEGPFWWVHIANEVGFKPYLGLFIDSLPESNIPDLRYLVTNGMATASIHSWSASWMFFFDHQNETSYSDIVQSNYFYYGAKWHSTHGIPGSKSFIPHYSEIGPNAFPYLTNLGIEFIAIEVVPGTVEYGNPPAPWLAAGPYRRYEAPQEGQVNLPLFYADFLKVPGHPELDGKFFDRYTEVHNTASPGQYQCGEWCVDNDVPANIDRGTRQIKRAFDSQILASLYTHEWWIHPTTCCGSTTVTTNNWRAMLMGITNNIGSYQPVYVTTDYADQYVRATRTSRLVSSKFDPTTGQVAVSFTGKTNLPLTIQIYTGEDKFITNNPGTVPIFDVPLTTVAATLTLPPTITSGPTNVTIRSGSNVKFYVNASGVAPFSYQWYRDGTNLLVNDGHVSGATTTALAISSVNVSDSANFHVIVSNLNGTIASSAARLVVTNLFQPQIQSISIVRSL